MAMTFFSKHLRRPFRHALNRRYLSTSSTTSAPTETDLANAWSSFPLRRAPGRDTEQSLSNLSLVTHSTLPFGSVCVVDEKRPNVTLEAMRLASENNGRISVTPEVLQFILMQAVMNCVPNPPSEHDLTDIKLSSEFAVYEWPNTLLQHTAPDMDLFRSTLGLQAADEAPSSSSSESMPVNDVALRAGLCGLADRYPCASKLNDLTDIDLILHGSPSQWKLVSTILDKAIQSESDEAQNLRDRFFELREVLEAFPEFKNIVEPSSSSQSSASSSWREKFVETVLSLLIEEDEAQSADVSGCLGSVSSFKRQLRFSSEKGEPDSRPVYIRGGLVSVVKNKAENSFEPSFGWAVSMDEIDIDRLPNQFTDNFGGRWTVEDHDH